MTQLYLQIAAWWGFFGGLYWALKWAPEDGPLERLLMMALVGVAWPLFALQGLRRILMALDDYKPRRPGGGA